MAPGKKRIRLAELLTDAGYECLPGDLHAAEGWYRSSGSIANDDSPRWEGWTRDYKRLYSYYTMTELIKTGVEVVRHSMEVPNWYQVIPRKGRKEA
jgi:hypothetical protein